MVASDKAIGRKVYLIERDEYRIHSCVNRNRVYEIVRVIETQETKDGSRHFVVKRADSKQEVGEYDCVFAPDESKEELRMLNNYLADNGVYGEVSHYFPNIPAIVVSISRGDWKHDHGYCEVLMNYLGYYEIGNRVTEEDGSDCYSAEHYFLKG